MELLRIINTLLFRQFLYNCPISTDSLSGTKSSSSSSSLIIAVHIIISFIIVVMFQHETQISPIFSEFF